MELEKTYNSKEKEQEIYQMWEKGGYFTPKIDPSKKPFTIIMPPPNANGSLHVGHALGTTIQDIMIRYHRMKGDSALWLPGADHAGFETQVVYDKKLEKEGRKRNEIPKEQLLKEMMDFTLENKKIMEDQLRKLGASCDWTRAKFTLDEGIIKTVYATFEKLKQDGLIYKGNRMVNWCTKHQTTLSDVEIKYEEKIDELYFIKYPFLDERDGFVEVATTRPETMLGDTAVAVNLKDKRYNKIIGKKIKLPLVGRVIPIVADEAIDMEFGTGAVKVTPAHDFTDYEIWTRHQEEMEKPIKVIDNYGRTTMGARNSIVQRLKEQGFLINIIKNYKHNVACCYKCGAIIEPTLMDNQWFIKMASLRDLAVEAVKKGEIRFIPERFEKIFLQWMENLRDWNISRQIPWGISIPGETEQVFDTWFSSGQWPFATLQNTAKGDFEYFYPTTVMETGADIIFFWVARMVMLGIYTTGKIPFKNVYLHGMVRDKDKQKMSKSKGNVINPLGVVDEHGADALRMALVFANSPGQDIVFPEEKIIAQRRFANKIWNAARFVITQNGKSEILNPKSETISNFQIPKFKTEADKEILEALKETSKEITKDIENFQFHEAGQKIYHFFWHSFCDIYIEQCKKENNPEVLLFVLRESLKLLHPFMPFITEQIFQMLPNKDATALIIAPWPK